MLQPALQWVRRWAPELTLALLASIVFLGCLGSVDLWGKREQRASAEAIDTIQKSHWLVAEIQGRPRLEKPPLPRWTIATLMLATGRDDEWIVRLPSALSGLGMVALIYALGCRMGSREVGLAAGLVLASFGFFISELRQAGNDGPLAFFTTLALYAAWRRLHGVPVVARPLSGSVPPDRDSGLASNLTASITPASGLGSRCWARLMYLALGLGFLSKGPIILILVAVTLVPYLLLSRRFREGTRALVDGWGLLLFALLALCWPVPVLLSDPKAGQVWYLEMAQKAGTAGIKHHRNRQVLAMDWAWMTAPWIIIATTAVALPFLPRGRSLRPAVWFPWWWAIGNLGMFCLWTVAKPNYYLPCLPGVALLTGLEWIRLTSMSRAVGAAAARPRRMLQVHWLIFFASALAAPVVVSQVAPRYVWWASMVAASLAITVVASSWAWRRGADAGALAPLVGAVAVAVLVVYGKIAPTENAVHSHRALAGTLNQMIPAQTRTVFFFHELDEGLWFYLRGRELKPVPGSQPKYNEALDLFDEFRENRIVWDQNERMNNECKILKDWITKADPAEPYVLIRNRVYDRFVSDPEFSARVTPVLREQGLKRNELILLRVHPGHPIAASPPAPSRR